MNIYSRGCACLLFLAVLAVCPVFAQTQSAPSGAAQSGPCPVKSEYRQFDFWVGESQAKKPMQ